MEIKLRRVTKLTIVPTGNIILDFDDNNRVIYTQAELKAKINNLLGGFETIKRMIDQSQSQSQSQIQIKTPIDITNTLDGIESNVKQLRNLLGL